MQQPTSQPEDLAPTGRNAVAGLRAGCSRRARPSTSGTPLFDGKTLDGWIQIENSATSLPSGSITDPAAFAARLASGPDAVSAFLRSRLQDPVKAVLAAFSASGPDAKTAISALAKDLNQVIAGPSIYDKARFGASFSGPKPPNCSSRIRAGGNWRA